MKAEIYSKQQQVGYVLIAENQFGLKLFLTICLDSRRHLSIKCNNRKTKTHRKYMMKTKQKLIKQTKRDVLFVYVVSCVHGNNGSFFNLSVFLF